jgi:hypothetical protein
MRPVRLGYPANPRGFPQFGVKAMLSRERGQTWDLGHRYVLATWTGTPVLGVVTGQPADS